MKRDPLRPFRYSSPLLTDLYEITMAAAYFDNRFEATATFELFVRRLPENRAFLLTAGLEQALDFLEQLQFEDEEIDFLQAHPAFRHVSREFFDYLRKFRFTGEVWAIPEGTPVFELEPLLRITAPIIEAQVVETFLLSTLTFQTLIASKAARVVHAAKGRPVSEFGSRRAHGPQAGVLAARAAFIGGCTGTSNVEAGYCFGIPTYGTLAHSFIMSHESELQSFVNFQRVFPDNTALLLDTYDTLSAVDKIIAAGLRPCDVRLDSGDLLALSQEVRERLNAAGLSGTRIVATSDLDEYIIERLLSAGAPLDLFGVGTALSTSKDEPALGAVYKLVELVQDGRRRYPSKLAEDKNTYPGSKQVFRFVNSNGQYHHDLVACSGESYDAEPLLTCVMQDGRRNAASPPLQQIRERARELVWKLPAPYHQLREFQLYPVEVSSELDRLLEQARREFVAQ